MQRPDFENIESGQEFNRWYWLKEELIEICKRSGLPSHGRKFDLRDR
ncbi:MAG: SAP domain-containing protein, partial [Bacteroidota bacterium]